MLIKSINDNILFQKVRNTSPPKNTKLMNMKNIKINNNLCNCCSLDSSLLLLLPPPPTLFDPKISSHEKFKVNNAGNNPKPITNPL